MWDTLKKNNAGNALGDKSVNGIRQDGIHCGFVWLEFKSKPLDDWRHFNCETFFEGHFEIPLSIGR